MTDASYGSSCRFGVALLASGLFAASACSLSSEQSAAGLGDGGGDLTGGTTGTGGTSSGAGTAGTSGGGAIPQGGSSTGGTTGTGGVPPEPPDPEEEIESAFEAPVATARFVWTANPESGNVAVIDAETFAVRLADAGERPTTVAALPGAEGEDGAIVLDEARAAATVFRVDEQGALRSERLETHRGANAVSVSPSGRFAVVWTDAVKFEDTELDPTDGLQDVTVIEFGEETSSTGLSVGYRPSQVVFDEEETRALVVTEPGLSVIELGGITRVSDLVALTEDPVSDPAARDVSVTPDGALALVRLDGRTSLGIVEVDGGERTDVELGDFVSDLDLSNDGRFAYAVTGSNQATVSTLVVIPVADASDPSAFARLTVENVVSRSVTISPDGSLALMYSNSTPNPYLAVLTSEDDFAEDVTSRALDLKAPVRAVFAAPGGRHGIAFQDTLMGSAKRGAFSLVAAEPNRAPKIVGTDAPPVAVAFSPDGESAVIATRDVAAARFGVYLVVLEHLEETLIPLASPPIAAGMVPLANRAFVAQAHPEGRITFVTLDDGTHKTLTGFELAGRVVE